jgi:hypothetical protein
VGALVLKMSEDADKWLSQTQPQMYDQLARLQRVSEARQAERVRPPHCVTKVQHHQWALCHQSVTASVGSV